MRLHYIFIQLSNVAMIKEKSGKILLFISFVFCCDDSNNINAQKISIHFENKAGR
jgi:hypothetical protein